MPTSFNFRPAEKTDYGRISNFLASSPRMHRHLDWQPPIEWLGMQPFWLAEHDGQIYAILALPPDPPGIAWVRVFACAPGTRPLELWLKLLEYCLEDIRRQPGTIIPSLALSDWYSTILQSSGFEHHQDIVGLERDVQTESPALKANPELFVRLMEPEDLAAVAAIDQEAFEPIWQNSLSQVEQAYEQSAIATVAEWENAIVGFQISTVNMFAAHLARLAVNPALQGRQIGTTLLSDLVQRCRSERLWQITINTQDDNHASLALYQRTGWTLTGERFPVYLYKD
jgi:ribosomal-protein-alanine N-acetyltransferase